ncbi:MAG: hypothetical protein RLZZ137_623 [Cyanobacteriota bacterium]|jgi:hypothetical protein
MGALQAVCIQARQASSGEAVLSWINVILVVSGRSPSGCGLRACYSWLTILSGVVSFGLIPFTALGPVP